MGRRARRHKWRGGYCTPMSGNGHDPLTKKMIDVLERIEGQIQKTNERLDAFRAEVHEDLAALRAGQTELRNDLRGLRTEARADHDDHAERLADHERRLAALERPRRRAG